MRRITILGAIINIILAILKISLGFLGHSQSLIADGVHSLADLTTDAIVLLASWYGSKEADENHPYGHARIETFATVVLGFLLILVAVGIGWDAVEKLLGHGEIYTPSFYTLLVAVVSILANEYLFHATMRVADSTRSKMLRANAWHHRTDALSSVVVLVGIGGTILGIFWLDMVAAIGVALMIARIGYHQVVDSIRQLIDTALDDETVTNLKSMILSVEGVSALHMLKTRHMGDEALVEVHIILNQPRASVSEGHQISEAVRYLLKEKADNIAEVIVHIDPEDDEAGSPNTHLPMRSKIIVLLKDCWQKHQIEVDYKATTLHYLDGQVHVDVVLPLSVLQQHSREEISNKLCGELEKEAQIGDVRIYFR
jgi:cation diffusion facilitator family transporter